MNPPVFGHGELRLVLLTLIAREPRHGYDLIHALNEHFEGDYSPSAGTIYPRLAKLQEEGLVSKTQDGRKTVYSITEAGRREVDERREEFERITSERTDAVRTIAQSARAGLAKARRGLRDELDQIAKQARVAAEDALRRERAAAEAEQAARNEQAAKTEPTGRAAPADSHPQSTQSQPTGGVQSTPPESTDGPQPTHPQSAHSQPKGVPDAEATAGSPPTSASDTPADPAAAAAFANAQLLRRVDVALQQFRMELRQDARETSHLGGLEESTVSEIETLLHETRRRVGSLLRVHR